MQRHAANLAHALGDIIGHREQLRGVFIQEQMVIAEMRSADVPVEVFRLQIKRKNIREDRVHRASDVFHGLGAEVARSYKWSLEFLDN